MFVDPYAGARRNYISIQRSGACKDQPLYASGNRRFCDEASSLYIDAVKFLISHHADMWRMKRCRMDNGISILHGRTEQRFFSEISDNMGT